MDDVILARTNITSKLLRPAYILSSRRNLGELHNLPGFEVNRTPTGIHLCQSKHTLEIIADATFLVATPGSSPMVTITNLHQSSSPLFDDPLFYRELIGYLTYLNLLYQIYVSRFNSSSICR